ncbi:MAG: hypothetical protein ACOC1F_05475 [Myxococcota bacterium]
MRAQGWKPAWTTYPRRYVSNYIDDYRVKFVSDDKLIQARLNELQTGKQVEHIDWQTNPLYTGT